MTKKINSLNLQIVCNVGNYESIRMGMEWTPEGAENVAIDLATEMAEADAMLRGAVRKVLEERKNPASNQQPVSQQVAQPAKQEIVKEVLTITDKRVQAICDRIYKNAGSAEKIIEQTLQYFEPDEQVMMVLKTAANIN